MRLRGSKYQVFQEKVPKTFKGMYGFRNQKPHILSSWTFWDSMDIGFYMEDHGCCKPAFF